MTSTLSAQRRTTLPQGRPALSRCIGVPLEEFATEHWGRAPLLSPGAGPYDDLLDLADVDELLSRRGLRIPFLRIAKDGAVVPTARFTRGGGAGAEIGDQVDADAVLRLFADGATVVLQALHRTWSPVIDLTGRLARELGHPVQVNAYVTPPQSRGFSAHYDVHDVFVLQLAGRKHWTIHAPVLELPLRTQPWEQHRAAVAARADEPPHLDTVLEPGDALYLPRGWLHSARALGGTSAHLTIGVHALTRYALVEALLASAADDLDLRASLPLGLDPADAESIAPHLAAAAAALVRHAAGAEPADLAQALTRRVEAGTRPAPLAPLAQARAAEELTADDAVQWRPLLPPPPVAADGDHRRVPVGDRVVELPGQAGPALDVLAEGAPVRVADLPLPEPDALVVVRRLLREGVLVPR